MEKWGKKEELYSSGYVTFDDIRYTAGTKVFYHEIQSLKRVTDLKIVVAKDYPEKDVNFIPLDYEKFYPFNPFLSDYFASQLFQDYQNLDFLHVACSPGLAILDKVKPKHYTVHIMAHDLKESIEEHERIYGPDSYQFVHNTDPYLHHLLLKHAENADCIITASTSSKRWIENNIKCKKVEVIPHGTEVPSAVNSFPQKFTIGYLGAFGPDKGLPYLMLAWKYFLGRGEMVFGGSCCQFLQRDDAKKAFGIESIPNFRMLGWLPNISDFYNNISVYVQPSVTEGFGIEIPEAMAYGRPVIVTNTTGARDLVTNGVDGFIVPPRDPAAILDRINFFYNNPDKIKEMGLQARQKAIQYTWNNIEDRYMKLFTEIVS